MRPSQDESVEFSPSAFRPAWWLPGPHLQTLGARFLRSWIDVPLHRERLDLPDGDFIDLDFAFRSSPADDNDRRPVVLVLHGLEGSARSGYAMATYRALSEHGIDAIGLNFRSCGGAMNRLPRLYHSGETEDLRWVLDLLATRFPGRRRGAIGISLGGNVVLKYLGETAERARARVEAAAAISVPYDLSAGADYLERPGAWIYATHLLRSLRSKIERKKASMPPEVNAERALRARGFREFDDAATAPLHGFAGAEEYYRRSSSARFLDRIRVPTLLLHALDDPFLPQRCIPRGAIASNAHLTASLPPRGGHVGFVAGRSPFHPVFWAESECARFVAAYLSQ